MRASANRSFGIELASIAGLPESVVSRAKELLKSLEKNDMLNTAQTSNGKQISFFDNSKLSEVKQILSELNLDDISPRAAFDILSDLKEKVELDG